MDKMELWLREPIKEGFDWTIFFFTASAVLGLTWVSTGVMLEGYTEESIKDELFYGLEKLHAISFWLAIISVIAFIILVAIDMKRYSKVQKDSKIL